jgi:hypothetical protein
MKNLFVLTVALLLATSCKKEIVEPKNTWNYMLSCDCDFAFAQVAPYPGYHPSLSDVNWYGGGFSAPASQPIRTVVKVPLDCENFEVYLKVEKNGSFVHDDFIQPLGVDNENYVFELFFD